MTRPRPILPPPSSTSSRVVRARLGSCRLSLAVAMAIALTPIAVSAQEATPATPATGSTAGDSPTPPQPPVTVDTQIATPLAPPPLADAGAARTPLPPTAAAIPAAPPVPEWTRNLSVGGGTIIWYYQPLQPGVKNTIDLFFVDLLFDGHVGDVSLHLEPRFRDTKLRPHFAGTAGGTAWVQEAYAAIQFPGTGATLKLGKSYSHFALFWDNSFYGNVQVYDGLKLDPDSGLSLEGSVAEDGPVGGRYWLQFFLVDGLTNVALDGRETFSIPGARRRNQAIVRLEPFFRPAPNATVKVGLSGEFLQADLPAPVGRKDVYRGAVDVTLGFGPLSLWSELIRQNGQTVTDFPIAGTPASATTAATPGQASAHTNYFLVGAELALGRVSARYNLSYGGYRDLSISEWMHVPAVGVAVSPNVTLLGEFVYWKRYAAAGDTLLDKSINVTLQAHF